MEWLLERSNPGGNAAPQRNRPDLVALQHGDLGRMPILGVSSQTWAARRKVERPLFGLRPLHGGRMDSGNDAVEPGWCPMQAEARGDRAGIGVPANATRAQQNREDW